MKGFSRGLRAAMLGLALVGITACNSAQQGGGTADATDGAPASSTALPTADPDLFGEGRYVPAADVLAASENGSDILFVDSRTLQDYENAHIPGAASVPYFEVQEGAPEQAGHLESLPKDRWIVTYCECPHAEADQVAEALLAHDFTMVKVIDEGLQGWQKEGGKVESGPPPAEG